MKLSTYALRAKRLRRNATMALGLLVVASLLALTLVARVAALPHDRGAARHRRQLRRAGRRGHHEHRADDRQRRRRHVSDDDDHRSRRR